MRFHDNPAVLHYVTFVVVFFFEEGGGEGLEYGLQSMAEKCNHRMSQGKNLLRTESAVHYEYENLQLYLGNHILKFGVNG